jgi:hypothetical protein
MEGTTAKAAARKALVIGTKTGVECLPCEAALIKPLRPGSDCWFVRFPGDQDESGRQITRVRRVCS